MKILLITPPLTQLNTPYPATAYLTSFLRSKGYDTHQVDFSLELLLKIFSKQGLQILKKVMVGDHPSVQFFLDHFDDIVDITPTILRFLQNKDASIAYRISQMEFLPLSPRIRAAIEGEEEDPLYWAFGSLGIQDRARYLASLWVDDLGDAIHYGVDWKFSLVRYGEKLAASQASFDPLRSELLHSNTCIDQMIEALISEEIKLYDPDLLALTVPFPGNVYGAFRIAKAAKLLKTLLSSSAGRRVREHGASLAFGSSSF